MPATLFSSRFSKRAPARADPSRAEVPLPKKMETANLDKVFEDDSDIMHRLIDRISSSKVHVSLDYNAMLCLCHT